MIEMHLENWNLTPELALMLDIALRKDPQILEGLDWKRKAAESWLWRKNTGK